MMARPRRKKGMQMIRTEWLYSIVATCLLGGSIVGAPLTWYVSPQGNDAWSGTLPEANAARKDGPVATLEAGMAASRKVVTKEPRRIVLAEGRFYLKEMLALDGRDAQLTIEGAGQGKTMVYGGRPLTGWKKDGDHLWSTKLPADRPDWSFRVLVVNDALPDRARFPETGYLEHETTFPVRWMSTAGGGWERKPTMAEYTTMVYAKGDLPTDLRIGNAEVTVCHMWDESTLLVAGHDPATHTLTFADRGAHPPGAFRVQRYAVWNTREGMTHAGQWYLDKTARKVFYWPRDGEDMTTARVVAPTTVKILSLQGVKGSRPTGACIRALTLSAGDAPMKRAGFGGSSWPGTIHADNTPPGVRIEDVEVTNAGVWGVRGGGVQVINCHLHHLGGGGIKYWGQALIEGNHIHDIGLVSASAIGIVGGGLKSVIRRNVIHDTPYSGMSVSGTETLIEENLIYRCMLVHHDGAAIYMGGGKKCVIRRNLARDMVQVGSGYGVSAYYLDEKCRDCVVAENVAIDIPHPAQNHMTLDCELRDNVFICKGDMKIAFSRCTGHKVTGNTFHVEGKLTVHEPDAITEWEGNLIFTRNEEGGTVSDDVARRPFVPRAKPRYLTPKRLESAPTIDGKLGQSEWPSGGTSLGQRTSQRSVRGAPTSLKILTDDENLYILANVVTMFPDQRKLGTEWGKDEGIELAVEVRDGETDSLAVLRGFTGGDLQVAKVKGSDPASTAKLLEEISFAAGVEKKLWRSEWAIPLAAVGVGPGKKTLVSFNLTVYRSEDDVYAQYAGTLGETWDMKLAGRLMLNWDQSAARGQPAVSVPNVPKPPAGNDWPGKAIPLAQTPAGVPLSATPCSANVARCGNDLLVRVRVPTKQVTKGSSWRADDGAEVCVRGKTAQDKATTWVVRGYANGDYELSDEAGTPRATNAAVRAKVSFKAVVKPNEWIGEWRLPLSAMGVNTKGAVPFNLGVFRSYDREWINWIGTKGPTWKLEEAGTLKLR